MQGLDVYRSYLAMKQHSTNPDFDYFKYDGKVRAKEATYQERSDFYFFETLARNLSDQEIREYLLASFVCAGDPTKVWIGDIKRSGKNHWLAWQKQQGSLTYSFAEDIERLHRYLETTQLSFNNLFETSKGHPPLLKHFIKGDINLETLIILDMILGFMRVWDSNLRDPLWESISFKVKKYKPFLSIRKDKYTKLIKDKFL